MTRIEFRDGEREVPDHIAVLMKGIETHTMTYEQAVHVSEHKLVKDHLNSTMQEMVTSHLKGLI